MSNKIDVVNYPAVIGRSYYKLSLNEHRLIICALIQFQETKDKNILIEAYDFAGQFNLDKNQSYLMLKKAIEKLKTQTINIIKYSRSHLVTLYKNSDITEQDFKTLRNTPALIKWFENAKYCKGLAQVKLTFSSAMMSHLLNNEQPINYKLDNITSLKSSYAIRMYEILLCLHLEYNFTIKVDQLKKLLGVSDKYPRLRDFKDKVLEPSLLEINTHTNFRVKYKDVKNKAKVVMFDFDVKNRDDSKKTPFKCKDTIDMFK